MSEIESPAAFVTGAGRGIGRAIAVQLARAGFRIVVNDLPGSRGLHETATLLHQLGAEAKAVAGDISDLSDHDRLVADAWNAFGTIDCLVNNAGVSVAQRGDMLHATPESFDRLLNINLRGPFFLTQAVAARMCDVKTDRFRTVVTISSANAEFASIDRAEYCISKAGLSMMSSLFAARLAGEGINVYEVRPGIIQTRMTEVAKDRYEKALASGIAPIARWGSPDDVGCAVAALASGAFAYSTGEVIRVDGGLAVRRL